MPFELLTLRLIHILAGTFWVGSGVFTSLFLMPALGSAGAAAGPVLSALQRRHLFTVLPIAALLTILSGLRLMWIVSGGFSAAYFDTRAGFAYALSGGATILAFVVALLVSRPAGVRAAALGSEMATAAADRKVVLGAELDRVRRRGAVSGSIAVALLVAGAAGMAVARYL